MSHRCFKNRRCESSCVKTPLIFLSTPSHKCEHNFLYLIFKAVAGQILPLYKPQKSLLNKLIVTIEENWIKMHH